jgi:hypothetical protein
MEAAVGPGSSSIIEVISQYVPLKKAGKEYAGLCPFHQEKTPSFHVNDEKNLFYCHGCHEGGNVISFIQKVENLDYAGALRRLGLSGTYQKKSSKQLLAKDAARTIRSWSQHLSNRILTRLRGIGQESVFLHDQMAALPYTDPLLKTEMARLTRLWDALTTFLEDLDETGETFPIPMNQKEAKEERAKRLLECWKEREAIESVLSRELANSADDPDFVWPTLTEDYKEQLRAIVVEDVANEREWRSS